MKILNLIIKQQWLDKILSGEKTVETRDITPKTASRYVYYADQEGRSYKAGDVIPEDVEVDVFPIHYDAIRFYVGYRKDRQSVLIRINGSKIFFLTDDNGDYITYTEDGQEYAVAQIDYSLGEILEK